MSRCLACNGRGWYYERSKDVDGNSVDIDCDCPECDGTGDA